LSLTHFPNNNNSNNNNIKKYHLRGIKKPGHEVGRPANVKKDWPAGYFHHPMVLHSIVLGQT
jgi:hypothetical protein